MSFDQIFLLALLGAVLALFVWGRWRYDIVAFAALLAATLAGTVPFGAMFAGFGHPATVTVALVLIVSRGLQNSGAVQSIGRLIPSGGSVSGHVGALAAIGGALSAVMNNVGALALLMPAALHSAARAARSPALLLMPLSFGSILGGLVTLIGTPPNIIVATFREDLTGESFAMFDFTPVGGAVALAGIVFVALVGWRLVPESRRAKMSARELFEIEAYLSEAVVEEKSPLVGKTLQDADTLAEEHNAVLLGLIRADRRIEHGHRQEIVLAGDVLVLETGPDALSAVHNALKLHPADIVRKRQKEAAPPESESGEIVLTEAVVLPKSSIIGRTVESLRLRRRHGVNLLAVSRRGQPFRGRLRDFRFRASDVLLLEGDPEQLPSVISSIGCLPLAHRALLIQRQRQGLLAIGIFAGAVAAASLGVVSLPAAFAAAVGLMVLFNIVPARDIYDAVDWPVIVLLGAMIPVGGALQASGATALMANGLVDLSAGLPAWVILALVLIVTMTLSDVMNNAATAVVMAPISIGITERLSVNPDSFLMAVAVGASCAFLTPIGHQNNTLILGPGGYHFGDYWRMGLPLEATIVIVSIPMLLWIWPL
ncbi:MAG: SLC13 family permease [Alphaproteobacteria bacterium]|nr:SLC13 family permease [Alphaproteobacteria bacterium]